LLFDALMRLRSAAALPQLNHYGIKDSDLESLAKKAATKTNPVALDAGDYHALLSDCL